MGPFKAPYYEGPPVPMWNKTHDALVDEWKIERQLAEKNKEN